jgi:protein SCO1/2
MMAPRRLAACALLMLAASASSASSAAAAIDPADLAFRQHLDLQLPSVQGLRDQDGHAVGLEELLHGRPAVFVLGYYHCPMLCSTVMDGVLESLHGIGVPYEVLTLSIDPDETPADARLKYDAYQGLMDDGMATHLHMLTGTPAAIHAVAEAAGFPYRRDPRTGQYAHPAGFLVLTPTGRISRYILGVRYRPRDVRLALVDAGGGKVGTLADQLVLLCSHYDPQSGRYNVAAMALARAAGLGTLAALLLALYALRRRRSRP